MRNKIIILMILSLLGFGNVEHVSAQEKNKQYDLIGFLKKLDSLGVDTGNDTLMFDLGYQFLYYGKNERGNALIEFALSKREITDEDYHEWSVQNTKNGNYIIAMNSLEKAFELNPQEVSAYFGWVLLYYYRDYNRALAVLEECDAFTPNFSDAPMGEDIHYLKGLSLMGLNRYSEALSEFGVYINNLANTHGEDFVDVYTFVQKGRCLAQLDRFEEAVESFNKAIHYHENCSEAYYFMGLTRLEMKDKIKACENFNVALDLINKGYKSSDSYVEYFHEIYPQQIEQSIAESCVGD